MSLSGTPWCCEKCTDDSEDYEVFMNRDLRAEQCRGGVDYLMKEHIRYSASLGVLDEDLPAARKLHPQCDWKKFGNSWRPKIRNRQEKKVLMSQAGMFEY